MRFENKTNWNSTDLKHIIKKVANSISFDLKRITIIIKHSKAPRQTKYSGRATIIRSWIKMKVPKTELKTSAYGSDGTLISILLIFNTKAFAQVLTHEMFHNLGQRHKDMVKLQTYDVDFIKDFEVRKKSDLNG